MGFQLVNIDGILCDMAPADGAGDFRGDLVGGDNLQGKEVIDTIVGSGDGRSVAHNEELLRGQLVDAIAVGGHPIGALKVELAVLIEGGGQRHLAGEGIGAAGIVHGQHVSGDGLELVDDGRDVHLHLDGTHLASVLVIFHQREAHRAEEGGGELGVVGEVELHGGLDVVARSHLGRTVVGRGGDMRVAGDHKHAAAHGNGRRGRGHDKRCTGGLVVLLAVALKEFARHHSQAEGVGGMVHYLAHALCQSCQVQIVAQQLTVDGGVVNSTAALIVGVEGGEVLGRHKGRVYQVHQAVLTVEGNARIYLVIMAGRRGREQYRGLCYCHLAIAMKLDGDILVELRGVVVRQYCGFAHTETIADFPCAVVAIGARRIEVCVRKLGFQPLFVARIVSPTHNASVGGVFVDRLARRSESTQTTVPISISGNS